MFKIFQTSYNGIKFEGFVLDVIIKIYSFHSEIIKEQCHRLIDN